MARTARRALVNAPINLRSASTPAAFRRNGARKKVLTSTKAAPPIGPYSQGIQAGPFVFVAGEKGVDVNTGKLVPGGIVPETRQTLENIKAILAQGGATLDDAVAATVHMTDLKDFPQMNEVFAEYFRKDPPGRTTVQVCALPAGASVEITVVAIAPSLCGPAQARF